LGSPSSPRWGGGFKADATTVRVQSRRRERGARWRTRGKMTSGALTTRALCGRVRSHWRVRGTTFHNLETIPTRPTLCYAHAVRVHEP
jgi:hypothetical protein